MQAPFVETGKILDGAALRKGARVLIVPFKAGAGVPANENSDRIALMIVKGIADAFTESGSTLQVLGAENAHEADFVMTGHITEIAMPSKFDRWLFKTPRNAVGVEGRLTGAASKEIVLVFTDRIQEHSRKKNHDQLGYDVGKDIGRFILSAL